MIMSDHIGSRSLSPVGRMLVAALVLALPVLPALGQRADPPPPPPPPQQPSQAKPSSDEEIRQLRERVRELEQRLARAEQRMAEASAQPAASTTQPAAPATADAVPVPARLAAPEEQRRAEQAKARQRMRADNARYTRDQIAEAEEMYQVANKNWRSDEARQSLEAMVAKYPDLNRTGCAILYLGQYSRGEQRERYLKQAVEKYSDCFYGNGVQVGAFARYLLALDYQEAGKTDEATRLFREILTKYPKAVTHRGDDLAQIVKEQMKAGAPATAPATGPAAPQH